MATSTETRSVLYIADPMCSWCWGFAPVIEEIRKHYEGRLTIQLLMGGLRPGNTERFDEQRRNYILGHWRAVHERTAQPFNFTFLMSSDFTYDTEPASRAVIAVRQLLAHEELSYFHKIQHAFYVDNSDVTKEQVLCDIACAYNIIQDEFLERFRRGDLKRQAWEEFDRCRQLGVSGFPTLLAQEGERYRPLSNGYESIEAMTLKIDAWSRQNTP